MNKGLLLEIPYGTRDFLPKDAKVKREIESKLAKNFSLWGYDEIEWQEFNLRTVIINDMTGLRQNLPIGIFQNQAERILFIYSLRTFLAQHICCLIEIQVPFVF